MEYKKNFNGHFLRPKKSLLWGILFSLIAVFFSVSAFIEGEFKWFYLLYSVILLFNGVVAFAKYKGHLLWNKSYIEINDESIEIKVISQKKKALWKNIESIELADNKLRLHPNDKNFQYVSFDSLETETVNEITSKISEFAELKGIGIKQ